MNLIKNKKLKTGQMDYNNFALGEMSLSMFMYEVFTPKFLPLSAQVRGMI